LFASRLGFVRHEPKKCGSGFLQIHNFANSQFNLQNKSVGFEYHMYKRLAVSFMANTPDASMRQNELWRMSVDDRRRELTKFYVLPMYEACKQLDLCQTSFKVLCRSAGIKRWPFRKFSSFASRQQTGRDVFIKKMAEDIESQLAQNANIPKKNYANASCQTDAVTQPAHCYLVTVEEMVVCDSNALAQDVDVSFLNNNSLSPTPEVIDFFA
jgi:hypothetical protein